MLCEVMRAGDPIATDIAVILSTSGSSGIPKGAQLTATALTASASATTAALGGPGQWLLALPPDHVAGLQVLLRSLAAGYEPVLMDTRHTFTPHTFVDAINHMTGHRRYCSLVPTQISRLLHAVEHGKQPISTTALVDTVASLDAILVGGAPLSTTMLNSCKELGWRLITTYGSSETAGGIVYNGTPLPGTTIRIQPLNATHDGSEGRILLGGPTLASGYRNADILFNSDDHNNPSHHSNTDPSRTNTTNPFVGGWFITDDIGRLRANKLEILGRYDQAINTGGLKVLPEIVETAARRAGYTDCAVLGIPSQEWGESVCLVIEDTPHATTFHSQRPRILNSEATQRIRARLDLPAHALPTTIALITTIPLRGPGKTDRHTLRQLLATAQPPKPHPTHTTGERNT